MQFDFEIQRSTRRCAATDRPLEPGQACYSVLEMDGANIIRKDFAADAWSGPPVDAFGWWKSCVPEPAVKKIKLAPNDVLLNLFDQLEEQPDGEDMRYVLALLLVRRRVFRMESESNSFTEPSSPQGVETITVFCPKRDATYELPAVMPTDSRIEEIQLQLSDLLVSGGEESPEIEEEQEKAEDKGTD
jgi:hypothetical protein